MATEGSVDISPQAGCVVGNIAPMLAHRREDERRSNWAELDPASWSRGGEAMKSRLNELRGRIDRLAPCVLFFLDPPYEDLLEDLDRKPPDGVEEATPLSNALLEVRDSQLDSIGRLLSKLEGELLREQLFLEC